MQTPDKVSLDDLSGDIGDESLLLDLLMSLSGHRTNKQEIHDISYLINGSQAVQSFFAAEILHVCSLRIEPTFDGTLDDLPRGSVLPFISGVVSRRTFL